MSHQGSPPPFNPNAFSPEEAELIQRMPPRTAWWLYGKPLTEEQKRENVLRGYGGEGGSQPGRSGRVRGRARGRSESVEPESLGRGIAATRVFSSEPPLGKGRGESLPLPASSFPSRAEPLISLTRPIGPCEECSWLISEATMVGRSWEADEIASRCRHIQPRVVGAVSTRPAVLSSGIIFVSNLFLFCLF